MPICTLKNLLQNNHIDSNIEIPGSVYGQVRQGLEQPVLMEGVPNFRGGSGMIFKVLPNQTGLGFSEMGFLKAARLNRCRIAFTIT